MKSYQISSFEDADGNEICLYVLGRLEYEGKSYAALIDADAAEKAEDGEDTKLEIFVMECYVDENEDYEVFAPVEDEKTLNMVTQVIYTVLLGPDSVKQ